MLNTSQSLAFAFYLIYFGFTNSQQFIACVLNCPLHFVIICDFSAYTENKQNCYYYIFNHFHSFVVSIVPTIHLPIHRLFSSFFNSEYIIKHEFCVRILFNKLQLAHFFRLLCLFHPSFDLLVVIIIW